MATSTTSGLMDNEKIQLLEKEIQEVIKFCQSSGLNHDQLVQCAEPLLQKTLPPPSYQNHNSGWKRKLLMVSAFVVLIGVLFQWSVSYKWICVFAKCFAVKLLPYWDWTVLYEETCILYNPYQAEVNLTEQDCEVCEDYGSIDRQQDINHGSMTDEYLFDNMPVVVTDAERQWKASQEFNIDYIKQLYKGDKVLSKFDLCNYHTASGHRFVQVRDDNVPQFHIYWENCFMEPVRALRAFYTRPYFLPPMVEMGMRSLVAMATPVADLSPGQNHYKFLSFNSTDSLTWFSQIKGQYLIQLQPQTPCDKICQDLNFVLKEGETLVIPNDMWLFQFAPHGENPSIAIGATGNWDQ